MAASGKKSIKGGCHCGFITYIMEVKPDAESGHFVANRCNCTFCQKLGTTNLNLEGPSDFKLVSPASADEAGNYAPRVKTVRRHFCKTCGTHVWMEGYYEYEGQRHDLFVVNLATVDQPQEGVDLNNTKISYFDGLHDNYAAGLKDKPHPNGLI